MRLYATVFPGERKLATVTAAIEITAPTKALLGPDAKLHDQVSYGVLVVDEKKTKVTSRTNLAARIALKPRVAVPSPEDDPNMPSLVAYQIPLTLELAPGKYQLRASATSTRLGKGGSVYLTIEVPDFAKEPLTIAGVTLGYVDGERVPVADLPKQAPRREARAPFAPSLDRVFTPADTLRLYFEVARRNAAAMVRTKVEILDAQDDVRAWVDREVPAERPRPRRSQAASRHARAWRLPPARHRQRRHEQRGAGGGDLDQVSDFSAKSLSPQRTLRAPRRPFDLLRVLGVLGGERLCDSEPGRVTCCAATDAGLNWYQ